MTREEIEHMEAGPEMDALIAEHIMGHPGEWIHHEGAGIEYDTGIGRLRIRACLEYSTDIAAAFQVVEKLEAQNPVWLFSLVKRGWAESLLWEATFRKISGEDIRAFCEGITAPLAICRAALLSTLDI